MASDILSNVTAFGLLNRFDTDMPPEQAKKSELLPLCSLTFGKALQIEPGDIKSNTVVRFGKQLNSEFSKL